ncbi:Ribokinase [Paramicrosporidium saccamoebae]|uniref:Ribokinase n=1 Tax=Paramicrosporidium saccamoebae TaxID=1246581 RepID=A0A2H9TQW4_9FUNG|nr:Ribokinase [Paramicrosporidium saccamoebae]
MYATMGLLAAMGLGCKLASSNIKESGHTVIQLQEHNGGENAILLHYGANFHFTKELIRDILIDAKTGDYLLLQCETNLIDYAMGYAKEMGMTVVFNTAPYPPHVGNEWKRQFPSDWIIANRSEAEYILQHVCKADPRDIGTEASMQEILSATGTKNLIVTLGSAGCRALLKDGLDSHYFDVPAFTVTPVDTTGAGDVFIGYFLTTLIAKPGQFEEALLMGNAAAALACTRKGALCSTPTPEQVCSFRSKTDCSNVDHSKH